MSDTQTPLVVQCRVCWQFYGVERGTRASDPQVNGASSLTKAIRDYAALRLPHWYDRATQAENEVGGLPKEKRFDAAKALIDKWNHELASKELAEGKARQKQRQEKSA